VEALVEAPVAGSARAASGRGSETVLVVEDEDAVRALAIEILREQGYTTMAAADGAEALRVAARHPGPLHLLLTDVVMPHLNGWELARQLSAVRPETKVLYMTGYSEIAVVHEGVSDAIVLQKPFTPDILARRVRETIQAEKIAG
jgi:CheY-like chemotaxis protein